MEMKSCGKEKKMQLWKQISIGELSGGFVMPADLTGDGQVELLLSHVRRFSAHIRLTAMDLDGTIRWSYGDSSVTNNLDTQLLRPPITAFDFDEDGKTEVVAEFWNDGEPQLLMFDGATGEVLQETSSPFDLSVRQPEGYSPSRPSTQALVARLDGPDKPASIIIKYEASGSLPPVAAAYDHKLNKRWEIHGRPCSEEGQRGADMGHQAVVTDLTGNGRDDVILGQLAVDSDGRELFRRDLEAHVDSADVFAVDGQKRLFLTICKSGPAYCLDAEGNTIWQKTQEEVSHGQAGWVGNFIPERDGLEAMVLVSGHYGIFHTLAAEDGRKLAEFQHRSGITHADGRRKYPDIPVKVTWHKGQEALWVPVDQMILDGHGEIVADLGDLDAQVAEDLHPGAKKGKVSVQAVPVDLCGDEREELILYQPYQGKAVYIFTQADSDAAEKSYRPQEKVYNRREYL